VKKSIHFRSVSFYFIGSSQTPSPSLPAKSTCDDEPPSCGDELMKNLGYS